MKKDNQKVEMSRAAINSVMLIIMLFPLISAFSVADGNFQHKEYDVKAIFLVRFAHFIGWPTDSEVNDSSKPFRICVIGDNPFGSYLQKLSRTKTIKNKRIVVKYQTDITGAEESDLLFISNRYRNSIEELLTITSGKPILTVGEAGGLAEKGIIINFYLENDKIRFEINNSAGTEAGFVFSSRLLNLARIVE